MNNKKLLLALSLITLSTNSFAADAAVIAKTEEREAVARNNALSSAAKLFEAAEAEEKTEARCAMICKVTGVSHQDLKDLENLRPVTNRRGFSCYGSVAKGYAGGGATYVKSQEEMRREQAERLNGFDVH